MGDPRLLIEGVGRGTWCSLLYVWKGTENNTRQKKGLLPPQLPSLFHSPPKREGERCAPLCCVSVCLLRGAFGVCSRLGQDRCAEGSHNVRAIMPAIDPRNGHLSRPSRRVKTHRTLFLCICVLSPRFPFVKVSLRPGRKGLMSVYVGDMLT